MARFVVPKIVTGFTPVCDARYTTLKNNLSSSKFSKFKIRWIEAYTSKSSDHATGRREFLTSIARPEYGYRRNGFIGVYANTRAEVHFSFVTDRRLWLIEVRDSKAKTVTTVLIGGETMVLREPPPNYPGDDMDYMSLMRDSKALQEAVGLAFKIPMGERVYYLSPAFHGGIGDNGEDEDVAEEMTNRAWPQSNTTMNPGLMPFGDMGELGRSAFCKEFSCASWVKIKATTLRLVAPGHRVMLEMTLDESFANGGLREATIEFPAKGRTANETKMIRAYAAALFGKEGLSKIDHCLNRVETFKATGPGAPYMHYVYSFDYVARLRFNCYNDDGQGLIDVVYDPPEDDVGYKLDHPTPPKSAGQQQREQEFARFTKAMEAAYARKLTSSERLLGTRLFCKESPGSGLPFCLSAIVSSSIGMDGTAYTTVELLYPNLVPLFTQYGGLAQAVQAGAALPKGTNYCLLSLPTRFKPENVFVYFLDKRWSISIGTRISDSQVRCP
ncbi:hypothetical protein DES52_11317 [Deinococcus yavapaiensis KR-236]|uniref:Uncharacterized protein n=2 Tax=Deinococcus TaxID=1298 RepID=A0A318S863_9DEIO|nr:hypothetical protein DES52_11317 [Deinococcus yavapaiensis KR-236]